MAHFQVGSSILALRHNPWTVVDTDCRRFVDPVFAVCVGLSAAAVRIRREQREKYPDQDSSLQSLWQKGLRMTRRYFAAEVETDK